MADYGIKVSRSGMDARTASSNDLLLNMKYPIAKLDVTKSASFQNITLTFVHDPPEPPLDSANLTVVHSFPHGYDYVPQTWSLINVIVPPPGQPNLQPYNQDYVLLSSSALVDTAYLYVRSDKENINICVEKIRSSLPDNAPNPLVSCVVKIRVYVFAEDVTS